ncbi:hypothetical protein SOVF_193890, partial [Spinacia oleracea]
MFNMTVQTQNT